MDHYKLSGNNRYVPVIILFLILCHILPPALRAQTESLRINEFMALNLTTIADEEAEYSDWIEIHNPTQDAVYLYGWSLTDDVEIPRKWIFPAITIQSGEYMVLFASGKNRSVAGQELHTNFRLE